MEHIRHPTDEEPMNAVVEVKNSALAVAQQGGRMAVSDIISHVATVQEVMRAVMKPDVHFGTIPGTDKPTLLKPGAEVLCMAFRIADSYAIEDLSTADTVRYRVTCTGTHQTTGVILGTGMGEASSAEEKYKWRKAYKDEFEATPPNLRREKKGWDKFKKQPFTVMQVRTEPADLANTVLKMANKRAKMAMVLNVTAASDCFSQDLEDMDEALRDHLARHQDEGGQAQQAQQHEPKSWPDEELAKREPKMREFFGNGKTADDVIAFYGTKGVLSDAQKARIRSIAASMSTDAKKAADSKKATVAQPSADFEEITAALAAAELQDDLKPIRERIALLPNDAARAQLSQLVDARSDELPPF
jgi:purine-nucleoside phosphorylase